MSENDHRILIVNNQRDETRVIRARFELLNQGYILVDVPSAEEAMLELSTPFTILIAGAKLPGMGGVDFLRRMRRSNPEVKGFIISDGGPAALKKEIGDTEVSGIFDKPLDIDALTYAVQRAIHGETEASALPQTGMLGQIPEFDERPIFITMGSLFSELRPIAVAFVNRTGKVVLKQGTLDASLRFDELAVLLAYNLNTTAEISDYLGEGPSPSLHYYAGSAYDIYTLSVGVHYFLAVIFPSNSQKEMAPILRFGKRAATEIAETFGDAAYGTAEDTPEAAPDETSTSEPEPISEPVAELESAAEDEGEEEETDIDFFNTEADDEEVEMLDLDFDEFDELLGIDEEEEESSPEPEPAQIDSAELDEASEDNELDDFWAAAAAEVDSGAADSMSLDEAKEMGFLDFDD